MIQRREEEKSVLKIGIIFKLIELEKLCSVLVRNSGSRKGDTEQKVVFRNEQQLVLDGSEW